VHCGRVPPKKNTRGGVKRCGRPVRCDQPQSPVRDNLEGDIARCLRRRDDESIESYLIRAILLLGSIANQSNSSAGPTNCKSCVTRAVDDAVECIKRAHCPGPGVPACPTCTGHCTCSNNDNNRTVYHGGRQYNTPGNEWLPSPAASRVRFTSSAYNRYSGNRSTYYNRRDGAMLGRAAVSTSSSFNAVQPADLSRPPPFPDYSGAAGYRSVVFQFKT